MKIKLTEKQAEAILNLRTNNHFKEFLGVLVTYGESTMEKLVFASKENLDTMQGKAQAITEILGAIEDAEKTFTAYKQQGNDTHN